MAKSLRSKREKRLRAIRREMVEPLYNKQEAAKLAAQAAALAAPKLPVRPYSSTTTSSSMEAVPTTTTSASSSMDVEMSETAPHLKPAGGVGKKMKKKLKIAKGKRRGKGKIRKRHV